MNERTEKIKLALMEKLKDLVSKYDIVVKCYSNYGNIIRVWFHPKFRTLGYQFSFPYSFSNETIIENVCKAFIG